MREVNVGDGGETCSGVRDYEGIVGGSNRDWEDIFNAKEDG